MTNKKDNKEELVKSILYLMKKTKKSEKSWRNPKSENTPLSENASQKSPTPRS